MSAASVGLGPVIIKIEASRADLKFYYSLGKGIVKFYKKLEKKKEALITFVTRA